MAIADRMAPLIGGSSAIRKMFEEGRQLAQEYGAENVYDFSLGNPSVPAPASVNETAVRLLRNEDPLYLHGYMNNSGFEETRQAVADDLNKRFGASFAMTDIIMTVGAAAGINDILHLFLNPGDEVIAFAPFFTEYRNYTIAAGGNLVAVPADMETFQLNIDALDALIKNHADYAALLPEDVTLEDGALCWTEEDGLRILDCALSVQDGRTAWLRHDMTAETEDDW